MTDHPDAPETAWVFLHPNLRQILQDASSEYMHAGEAVKAHNMRCALQALDRMAKVICIFNKMSKGGTAIEPNSLNGLFKAWLDDALKDIEERQETVEPKKKSNKEQFLDMLDSSIPSDANSFSTCSIVRFLATPTVSVTPSHTTLRSRRSFFIAICMNQWP